MSSSHAEVHVGLELLAGGQGQRDDGFTTEVGQGLFVTTHVRRRVVLTQYRQEHLDYRISNDKVMVIRAVGMMGLPLR